MICQSIVDEAETLCPSIVDDAAIVRDRFAKCFTLFANCHNLYSRADKFSEEEVTQLGMPQYVHKH